MITRLIDYIEKKKCDLIFCKHQMISEKDHFVKKNYTEEKIDIVFPEYSYAAEPPVQFRLSHLSRRSEPL